MASAIASTLTLATVLKPPPRSSAEYTALYDETGILGCGAFSTVFSCVARARTPQAGERFAAKHIDL